MSQPSTPSTSLSSLSSSPLALPSTAVNVVFARPPGCPHAAQPLFASEYKRTNRTRATKIVRCFPHCCPDHRPRSYCGTSLYVEVSLAADTNVDGETLSSDDLVVFGRFEVHRPQPPATGSDDDEGRGGGQSEPLPTAFHVGQEVRARDMTESSDVGSIWVKAERLYDNEDAFANTAQRTTNVFVLQGSDDVFHHWESDWKSGTSQQHRLTPHHFRVYVFARPTTDAWQVVGLATSPPFTFAVYRKHQHDPDVLRRNEIQDADVNDDDDDDHNDDGLDEAEHAGDDNDNDNGNQAGMTPEMLRDLVWHRQHRSAATNTTNISILVLLAREADPRWLTASSRTLYALLESATDASVPNQLLLHYVNHCVPQLLAFLLRNSERRLATPASAWIQDDAASQAMMETIAELQCFILNPVLTKPVLAFITAHASPPLSLTDEKRRELLLQWIDMIAEQIEDFFQRRGQSTESFVDDVVSVALRDHANSTKHVMRELLRNTRVLGQRHFDALLAKLRATAQRDELPPLPSVDDDKWAGRWLCRSVTPEASIHRPDRRRSWPQVAIMRLRLEDDESRIHDRGLGRMGMMSAIAVVLSSVGFDLARCGDDGNTLRLDRLATVLDQPTMHFQLDHVFRDATQLLPLEWATLLVVGESHRHVFCRARALDGNATNDNDGDEQLEIEFLVCDTGLELPSTWRCVLRLEIPSTRIAHGLFSASSLVLPRRRLVVHVRVDDAHGSEPQSSQHSHEADDAEKQNALLDRASHHGFVDTDSDPCIDTDGELQSDAPRRLYNRVERWDPRIAFQSTYYALE